VETVVSQEILIRQLIAIMKTMDARFSLSGTQLSLEEVFKVDGMLPAIARRADQLSSLCLGYGIGINFDDDKETKLGMRVKFDEVTPNVLRYLTILDVVNELMARKDRQGVTPLDVLLHD
jgi:intracellular multiplication protein IcmS